MSALDVVRRILSPQAYSSAVWRRRIFGFAVLLTAAILIDPGVLVSQELTAPGSPEMMEAASPPPGPYSLSNASYAPGRKLIMGMEGQTIPGGIRVLVRDADGEPVAGVPVVFEIVAAPKSGGGTITESKRSGYDGIAAATLTLGGEGRYLIAARTADMTGAMPHITAEALAPTWWIFLAFGLFGGLGLFLFGMELGSGGLQKVAGARMRSVLGALTRNRFMGVVLGTFVTALVQSSSATTVMVVGFVSAGLMSLVQALGVIMGANIGTTLTVQLIAFKITDYALLMIGVGFVMTVITRRKVYNYFGEIILGFGLIFYGMAVMSTAMSPLRSMPVFSDALLALGDRPLLGIIGAAVFTGLIQSSGATIGLAVVLASEGLLNLQAAMPIVFGANIGTTVTTLLAMVGASADGKRTGVAHLLFNVIGVLLFYPILTWYVPAIESLTQAMGSDSVAREVANGHMIFNVVAALLFLPFLKPFAWLVVRLVPAAEGAAVERPKYLNNDLLETPDMALAAAWQEVLRIADLTGSMVCDMVSAFGPDGEKTRESLRERHDEIVSLCGEVRSYHVRLAQKNLGLMQSREKQGHLSIVDDLRQMADFIGEDVVGTADALAEDGAHFSEQGAAELREYCDFTMEIHNRTMTAMRDRDASEAKAVRGLKDDGEDYERRLRDSHLARLDSGLTESVATSSAHMDLLSGMRQIGRHHFRICRMLEEFLAVPKRGRPAEQTAEAA